MTIVTITGFVVGGLAWIIYTLASLFYNNVIKEKKIQEGDDLPIYGKSIIYDFYGKSIIYDFIDLKPPYRSQKSRFYNSLGIPSYTQPKDLKHAHDLAISSGDQTSKTKI